MQHQTYIERDGTEIPVVVEFDYISACDGARGSFGEQLEPD